MRAIDRLRKAANLEATKKEVTLSDGTIFEMWVTPLTLAEKERALKISKDDTSDFALRLFLWYQIRLCERLIVCVKLQI